MDHGGQLRAQGQHPGLRTVKPPGWGIFLHFLTSKVWRMEDLFAQSYSALPRRKNTTIG